MVRSRDKLRMLTLNTHSLMEEDNAFCLRTLADAIVRERVDVVALQEVNQSADAPAVETALLVSSNFVPCERETPIRTDNFALALARLLAAQDQRFYWTWAYAHRGYRVYEEGVALFSRTPITGLASCCVSTPQGRCRRKIAGIRTQALASEGWFYSVHMGWWDDAEDPFAGQWERLNGLCAPNDRPAYLLGDFNSPARGSGTRASRSAGRSTAGARKRSIPCASTLYSPASPARRTAAASSSTAISIPSSPTTTAY